MTIPRWQLLIVIPLLIGSGALAIDLYIPALPALQEAFSTTAARAQATMSSFFLGFSLGQIFYGPLADRFGRKPPLYGGLLLFSLGSLGCTFATNIESLIVLRFVQALGTAGAMVIARAIVRDLFHGAEAVRFYTLIISVFMLVPMAGPIVGAHILQWFGWRALFVFLLLMAVFALSMAVFALPETHLPENRRVVPVRGLMREYLSILTDRKFFGYALAAGFGSGTLFSYITGSPHLLISYYGMSPQTFSYVFSVNALGILMFAHLSGRMSTRRGSVWALARGYLTHALAALFLFVAALTDAGLWVLLPALFCIIATYGGIAPPNSALAMEGQKERAGMASALFGTTQFAFASVIASALAAIHSEGPHSLAVVMAVCALCGFAINRFVAEPASDINK